MNTTQERNYIFNLETTKIELHFTKEEYEGFSTADKEKLKGAFLFSGRGKCWVSRAKEPHLYRATQVAKALGFVAEKREGERLSFAEQLEQKAERAEERAARYEDYAENATARAESLQLPLEKMHGDIAFFTQPIIAGHAGSQSFAKHRQRLFDRYAKGFEEYRKSDYFLQRAGAARQTANMGKLDDVAFIDRKIKECKKEIKKRMENIARYEEALVNMENGKTYKRYDGTLTTIEEISGRLANELELVEVVQDKEAYFLNRFEELGGAKFSSKNIEIGYIIRVRHYEGVEVIGKGAQNVTYKILTGGAVGMVLKAAYAEIQEVVQAEAKKKEAHPFTVGEVYKAVSYNSFNAKEVYFEIVKASANTIQLREKGTENKPFTRKPSQRHNGEWIFSIDDCFANTFRKEQAIL